MQTVDMHYVLHIPDFETAHASRQPGFQARTEITGTLRPQEPRRIPPNATNNHASRGAFTSGTHSRGTLGANVGRRSPVVQNNRGDSAAPQKTARSVREVEIELEILKVQLEEVSQI